MKKNDTELEKIIATLTPEQKQRLRGTILNSEKKEEAIPDGYPTEGLSKGSIR